MRNNDAVAPQNGSPLDRSALAEIGHARAEELARAGVAAVALTWVDNVGVTRVKAVPVERFAHAAAWGVGMSTVHDVFQVDDTITSGQLVGGPVGDLRLHPDTDALTVLYCEPGWAWAPVDRWTQDGRPYPLDQRTFARRMVAAAEEAGLLLRMAFELEWYLATADGTPAASGSAYGMTRLMEVADYGRDLLEALAAQNVPVEQYHPEYAVSQFELSTSPDDPVVTADRVVLVRETIRAVSRRHGLRASFAPIAVAGAVGNGMHLHMSVLDHTGRNLFADGSGPAGLSVSGESMLARLLERLPALSAITAPSVSSHLRSIPQRWAGAYQCWGVENREAAIRLIPGVVGTGQASSNVELKCVDGSANPYLAVGAVCAIVAQGAHDGATLPQSFDVDPVTLPAERQPPRLPESVGAGLAALAEDDRLLAVLGPELVDAFRSVQMADAAAAEGQSAEDIVNAVRWRY